MMERCAILFADSSGLSSVPEGGAVRAQSRRSGVLHRHVAIAVFLWLICVVNDDVCGDLKRRPDASLPALSALRQPSPRILHVRNHLNLTIGCEGFSAQNWT
jgi:hypothetical protein